MTNMRSTKRCTQRSGDASTPRAAADEPEDGHAESLAVHGEAEVDVGEVDEDGE